MNIAIKIKNNVYYIKENIKYRKISFLYEDENCSKPIIKNNKHKFILNKHLKPINEAAIGGAGYAVYGGTRGGYGNPNNGFGQSKSTGSGPNIMYTYSIMPLNHTLEPKPTHGENTSSIHVGSLINGKEFRNESDNEYLGKIISIKKDNDGNILYFNIITDEGTIVKIDPTSVTLSNKNFRKDYINRHLIGENELKNFFPRLNEELNASEALYGFSGWLTSRDEPVVFSAYHDAAIVAELINEFIKKFDLPDIRDDWEKDLKQIDEGLNSNIKKGLISLALLSSLTFANAQSKKAQDKFDTNTVQLIEKTPTYKVLTVSGIAAVPKEEALRLYMKDGKQSAGDYTYKSILSDSWKNCLFQLKKEFKNYDIFYREKIGFSQIKKPKDKDYLYFRVKYKLKLKRSNKTK